MDTTCPLPDRTNAGRNALRIQKCAKVFAPKVLLVSESTDHQSHSLVDIIRRQIEQQLALDHPGVVDKYCRRSDLS